MEAVVLLVLGHLAAQSRAIALKGRNCLFKRPFLFAAYLRRNS